MKALLVLALGMLLASTALAQSTQKKNEMFLSVGDAGLIFAIEDMAVTIGSLGIVTYGDQEGGYQLSGGYHRQLNRWASAGISASWAGSKKTVFVLRTPYGKVERRLLTLMADGRANWFTGRSVGLYSGLALGVAQLSDDLASAPKDDDLTTLGFHVTALGIRVGRDLGGFVEIGAGFNGFLEAGLSGRF